MNKWRKKVNELLYKEKCKLCLKKLVNKYGCLYNNTIISKCFNRWRMKTAMNKYKEQKINNYNKFCSSLKEYISNKIMQQKKSFLTQKIKKYININGDLIKKKLMKCFINYTKISDKLKKKKYLDKWKTFEIK